MKKISWKNYSKKLVIIFLVVIQAGCGTRKTDQIKEVEKIKSAEINTSADFSMSEELYVNNTYDNSFIYTREKDGLKETFVQNNKSTGSVKIIDSVRYITAIIYKTVATYKTIKDKKTQSNGVSIWVWIVGLFLVFVFAIILNFKKILTRYRRN
jgi:hypothetical protein